MRQFLRVPQRVHNAVILMADLAEYGSVDLVSLNEVAERNGLSRGFLEEVVVPLREAGLVEAKRGVGGGYKLARAPGEISVADIVTAIEGPVAFVDCLGAVQCPAAGSCSSKRVWAGVQQRVEESLAGMSLAEVIGQKK
ncbi:MAG: Rrf2 family transcriptional regulator [bacterium]